MDENKVRIINPTRSKSNGSAKGSLVGVGLATVAWRSLLLKMAGVFIQVTEETGLRCTGPDQSRANPPKNDASHQHFWKINLAAV